jgi:predicted lysophospholipase L1 biosynthesis ABC-type transport system permease subunit
MDVMEDEQLVADDKVTHEERIARYVNMGLASWLLVSAFLWRHDGLQFLVTVLIGAVVVALAPFAIGASHVRRLNAAAGFALAVAALALPRASSLTAWNNIIFGLAIAAVSMLPPREGFHTPHVVQTWQARHPHRAHRAG